MRRLVCSVVVTLLVASALAPVASGAPQPTTFTKDEVERDLALVLRRSTQELYDEAREPRFDVLLVNTSKARSYPVVLPNDGSDAAFREPHTGVEVESRDASGAWSPVRRGVVARCGLYAQDWTKDIVTLGPGARRKIGWFPWAGHHAPPGATHLRFRVTYAYTLDHTAKPSVLTPMPAFSLVSAPLEVGVKPQGQQ